MHTLRSINGYARDVVAGRVKACEYVKAACQRHLDDLKRAKTANYPYKFDKEYALDAIEFIEMMPHTKGRWAGRGETLTLEPWQAFITACIFGWVRKSDNLRRFLEAYIEVNRKNGKSIWAAAIGHYMAWADGEFGAEVYSGATTEKQAWEVYRPARLMAKRTEDMVDAFGIEVNAATMVRLEDFSRFEPLIGDPGDGASPSCAIVDEYHEHKKPNLYDTMKTGMGSREHPLMLIITTAGTDISGPCYEKRREVIKILQGVFDSPADERIFGIIYTIDDPDTWREPESWEMANPNLGVSVSRDYLEGQVAAAIRTPSKENTVKCKHFGVWSGAKSAWLSVHAWNSAADPSLNLADFKHAPCVAGLDLAVRVDMVARLLLFMKTIDGRNHFYAFPRFYLPEAALFKAVNKDRYAGWHKEGLVEVHEGEEVEFAQIETELKAVRDDHRLTEVGFDIWQATQMAQNLRDDNLETVQVKTTYEHMSGPMRELEAAIPSGRFHHPGHPVLDWMASNVIARSAGADDRQRPVKEDPNQKIDGIVALLMALHRAIANEDTISVYESRGLRTI